jgi:hypothetical protein
MPRAEIPEGAIEDVRKACATTREWATLAVEAAAPKLYSRWLEQLKEELLGKRAVEAGEEAHEAVYDATGGAAMTSELVPAVLKGAVDSIPTEQASSSASRSE